MSYFLIGQPLNQSHSPRIHALFGNEDYALKPIQKDELPAFLKARAFDGLNVTIPYKQAVIPYLDALSERAEKIGAVNTIKRNQDGTLFGDNTDYAGFAFLAARAGVAFYQKKVLVLGTGGTSRTVCAVARDQGAREIVLVSRTGSVNYQNVYQHADADVIVNTTPVGMKPDVFSAPVELSRFPSLCGVLDVIYNPLKTALIRQAKDRGLRCSGGLPMLVEQARVAEEVFFDRHIPLSELDRVLGRIYLSLLNVILIGMPGSGKTTLGRAVAESVGREIVDTDARVLEMAGMDIPDIFEHYGEEKFREMEENAVKEACMRGGLVIAMGGGSILSPKNRELMRMNGRIYLIERPLTKLARTGRPLSKSTELLERLQEKRMPLYRALSDTAIDNSGTLDEAARAISEDFIKYSGG